MMNRHTDVLVGAASLPQSPDDGIRAPWRAAAEDAVYSITMGGASGARW